MSTLELHLDKTAQKTIENLKKRYSLYNRADVLELALNVLKFASDAEESGSGIYVKKDNDYLKVIVK